MFHNNFLLYTRAAGPCSRETFFSIKIRIYFIIELKKQIGILVLSTMNLLVHVDILPFASIIAKTKKNICFVKICVMYEIQ